MKLLDATLATPAENLACDEALLDLCEEAGEEVLRFWESREPFVVVGYGNHIAREVNVEECRRRSVPILRRCSGGGTVVQGPGCLNYNLTLRIPDEGALTTVTGTNQFVMKKNRAALAGLLSVEVAVQGHTDLAFGNKAGRAVPGAPVTDTENSHAAFRVKVRRGEDTAPCHPWLKFSGNAQRRRRHALVFHGTILHDFDLGLIDALLPIPSIEPEYRAGRRHDDFVRNVAATPDALRSALSAEWDARETLTEVPHDQVQQLLQEHYLNEEWVFRAR